MLSKKTIKDLSIIDLKGKHILMRADFNVPLRHGVITDDSRIVASLPTIKYLKDAGAKIILASHLGRPDGKVVDSLRLNPVAQSLSQYLDCDVIKAEDCIGNEVEQKVNSLKNGQIMLLENVRFHAEEEQNDPEFAKRLASLADIFVFDAFGTAHRKHATTAGIANYLPAYAGLLVQKEINFLAGSVNTPKKPFVAIVGGAKVSTKIGILKNLLDKVDTLVVGGAMIFTFLKAQGFKIGKSIFEELQIPEAEMLLATVAEKEVKLLLPVDLVVTKDINATATTQIVDINAIPDDMLGVDIGPKTIKEIQAEIALAQTVLWNGPLGVFEIDQFAKGTFSVAQALADSTAITIVGGGDSTAAIAKAGLTDKITHISTGGGAALEFLKGIELPGVAALMDNK